MSTDYIDPSAFIRFYLRPILFFGLAAIVNFQL
jgi:hypothetical protein